MKKLILALALLLIPSLVESGQTLTTVSVTSATAGTQVVASIGGGTVITIPSTAAVPIWCAMTAGTCSTTLTSTIGIRISSGNGFFFNPKVDQWTGQVCCVLESGVVAVTVSVNSF